MENNSLMTNEMIEHIKQVMGQARANVAQVETVLDKLNEEK